jgi:hypothetical protein
MGRRNVATGERHVAQDNCCNAALTSFVTLYARARRGGAMATDLIEPARRCSGCWPHAGLEQAITGWNGRNRISSAVLSTDRRQRRAPCCARAFVPLSHRASASQSSPARRPRQKTPPERRCCGVRLYHQAVPSYQILKQKTLENTICWLNGWALYGLNLRPLACEGNALPIDTNASCLGRQYFLNTDLIN